MCHCERNEVERSNLFSSQEIASSSLKNAPPRNDTKRPPLNKHGIALIASVMLIVFVSIAVLSVTIFIVQRLSEINANRIYTNCIDLAQAGVHKALYDFRSHDLAANGYFSLGTTNIDANNSFDITATAADRLMVDTSAAFLSNNNKDLTGLSIQNVANSQSITIDRMIVSWNNNSKLTQIRINNSNVWSGNSSSPANADITNFLLNTTPTIYPVDRLRFSGGILGAAINIQFVMTDGSTTQNVQGFPATPNNNFTVKSTGRMTGSLISRMIQADYNAISGRIIGYKEL